MKLSMVKPLTFVKCALIFAGLLISAAACAQPDATVLSISSPSAVCITGTSYPVSVVVRNNATGAAITSMNLGFVMDNGTPTVEPWTGSLANNANLNYTFTASFSTMVTGIHMLKVFVKSPNGSSPDRIPANDTLFYPILVNSSGVPPSAYEGTDFWVGFMDNNAGAAVNLILFLTSTKASVANVTSPLTGFSSLGIAIPANGIIPVVIPQVVGGVTMDTPNSTVVSKTGIHVTSNNPISLYGTNQSTASTDAWTSIPVSNLGTKYLVLSPSGASTTNPSEFLVVSPSNGNSVTITLPAGKAAVGQAAGATWSVTLNQGESYLVKSAGSSGDAMDLTGALVSSVGPVAVFAGSACGGFPASGNRGGYSACAYCDHMVEQMIPTSAWGKNYVIPPFIDPTNAKMQTGGNYARVVTNSTTATAFTVSGFAAQSLTGVGNYMDYKLNANGAVINSSTNAIFVSSILAGDCCYGGVSPATEKPGDPATLNIIPEEQWGQYYPFATADPSAAYYRNFINIVSKSSTPIMYMDNVKVTGTFVAIPGSSYFYLNKAITQGNHYMISDTPIMVYVYGMTSGAESYAYPASGSTLFPISLPIKLLYFNAKPSTSSVKLSWATGSEKNSSFFTVERSADGINFSAQGANLNAAGNSAVTHTYQLIDENPLAGLNYYRLKQVDETGEFTYSNVVSVNLDVLNNIAISPQPVREAAEISFSSNATETLKITLFDIAGRLLQQFPEKQINEGENNIHIDLPRLNPGVYFLNVSTGNGFEKRIKMVKE